HANCFGALHNSCMLHPVTRVCKRVLANPPHARVNPCPMCVLACNPQQEVKKSRVPEKEKAERPLPGAFQPSALRLSSPTPFFPRFSHGPGLPLRGLVFPH